MAEWEAYSELEPFGPSTEFWRAGLIAAMILNVHRKEGVKPITAEDMMPEHFTKDHPKRRQTKAERSANFRALMRTANRQGSRS